MFVCVYMYAWTRASVIDKKEARDKNRHSLKASLLNYKLTHSLQGFPSISHYLLVEGVYPDVCVCVCVCVCRLNYKQNFNKGRGQLQSPTALLQLQYYIHQALKLCCQK